MRADGTPYLTKVNALTGLNLPHAVRFLEIIYNRIDPNLRRKYLVPPSDDITAFPAGIISDDFIKWFNQNYGTNFLKNFIWQENSNEIHLIRHGIESCFICENEYNPENFDLDEPWSALY
jgi:hypothetical protein